MLKQYTLCDDLIVCLNRLNQNPKLAVAIPREFIHNARNNLTFSIYCFEKPEIIHTFAFRFYMHKNFSYINALNDFIKAASTSGLIEMWRMKNRVQFERNEIETRKSGLVTIENSTGLLALWSSLIFGVMMVLCLEIIVHNHAIKPNAHRFWKLIEMIIDPERHFMLETKWT